MVRRLKEIVRPFVPPILLDKIRRSKGLAQGGVRFYGNYPDWQAARSRAAGYESPSILRKAIESALKVHSGDAPYERDTVIFDHIEYSFPLLAALLYVASLDGGRLSVLDFGGSLGSAYHQNKGLLAALDELRWSIVEQPHFVDAGKSHLATDALHFYESIADCLVAERPNFALLSSVLQYLEQPYALLAELRVARIPYLLIDRTPVLRGLPGRITVQAVPPEIYSATYPCRVFCYEELENRLMADYELIYPFESHAGTVIDLGDAKASYAGWFLRLREARA